MEIERAELKILVAALGMATEGKIREYCMSHGATLEMPDFFSRALYWRLAPNVELESVEDARIALQDFKGFF